jgi:hypothetical protein
VAINYSFGILLIKWLGTHAEYDKIDVKEVANTPEGDELDVLATLVDAYEAKHFGLAPLPRWRPSCFVWNRTS